MTPSKPPMGINVASDTKAGLRFADMIVDGHKTLESRNSDTLRPYVGKRVAIVRTGEGKAKAIGEVTIGEPKVVNQRQFRAMEDEHKVPEGSRFDINTPTKHLYPMHDPVRYEKERDVGHGIVSRQVIYKAQGGTVKNTFDYENPSHVEKVANIAAKHRDFNKIPDVAKHLAQFISQGSYKSIEDPRIQMAIRQAGHDGYHVNVKDDKRIMRKAAGGGVSSGLTNYNYSAKENYEYVNIPGVGDNILMFWDHPNKRVVVSDEGYWNPDSPVGDKLKAAVDWAHNQGYQAGVVVSPYSSNRFGDGVNTTAGGQPRKTPGATDQQLRDYIDTADFVVTDPYMVSQATATPEMQDSFSSFVKNVGDYANQKGKDSWLFLQGFGTKDVDPKIVEDYNNRLATENAGRYNDMSFFNLSDFGFAPGESVETFGDTIYQLNTKGAVDTAAQAAQPFKMAQSTGLTLPTDWNNYGATDKINWFNNNNVSANALAQAGISQQDINYMAQNGYTGYQPTNVAPVPDITSPLNAVAPVVQPYTNLDVPDITSPLASVAPVVPTYTQPVADLTNPLATAAPVTPPITPPMAEPVVPDILPNENLFAGMPLYKQNDMANNFMKSGGVVRKAMGGSIEPSIAQMQNDLLNNNRFKGLSQLQSIGAEEAPSMGIKAYVPTVGRPDNGKMPVGGVDTSKGDLPIGGIDMSQQQAGQQLMPTPPMPNAPPAGQQPGMNQVPQGDKIPTMDGTGMPPNPNANPNQMGSNILSMTPQGQAMAAMKPQGQPGMKPQGLKAGGQPSVNQMKMELQGYASKGYVKSTPKNPHPEVGKRFTATPQGNLAASKQFDIMKQEGKGSIVPIPYDATSRDNLVSEVSGHQLTEPLMTEAGFDYSRDPKHIAQNIGGASNLGIAGRVQDRVNQAAKENQGDVYLAPNTMGQDAENFSHHPAHIVLDLMNQRQLNKQTLRALSDDLRSQFEVKNKKKVYPYVNFLGFDHPNAQEQIMKGGYGLKTTAGNLRKVMMKRLGQVNIQKLLDYNLGDLKASILDPDLATDPKGYMGRTMVKAQAGAPLRLGRHKSYDTDYTGTYEGGMSNRPLEIMMPDLYQDVEAELKQRPVKKVKTKNEYRNQVIGALEKRKERVAQPINARVINNAGLYEEGLKNGEFNPKNMESVLAYFKRKGGYKGGGKVKLHDDQDTMQLELSRKQKVK